MLAYLNGILEYIFEDYIILNVNDIGYKVFISTYTLSQLPQLEQKVKIYTHMAVREDDISLYGFLTLDEIDMFNTLISVSGIGSKTALNILSNMRPENIHIAIITGDISALSKLPGIGKKTAQRMILDLKDKIKINTILELNEKNIFDNSNKEEAISALVSLGYSQTEARHAISNIKDNLSVEELIKLGLKNLAKF